MSKEAMKLALEALENSIDLVEEDYANAVNLYGKYPSRLQRLIGMETMRDDHRRAITALREALAEQPAQQEPVAWKLVPREPTHEMLKAMDECSTEGYDERLYAGHASSVYMAAVDAAPTPPAQRKPLTDEEIILIVAECAASHQHTDIHFARAIERAHGIKELV